MDHGRKYENDCTGEKCKMIIGNSYSFRFNIMVAGESGQGKTTFLKALLQKYSHDGSVSSLTSKTIRTLEIFEMGSFSFDADIGKCEVFLYDTPGYGESLNGMDGVKLIYNDLDIRQLNWRNIDAQAMTTVQRNQLDTRIHCVFYFIAAHRLKPIDLEFISQITPLVPIVPIIAKADTMTFQERYDFLCEVRREIKILQSKFSVPVTYDFCEDGSDFIPDNETSSNLDSDSAFSAFVNVGVVLACGSPESTPSSMIDDTDTLSLPKIHNIFAVVCDNSSCRSYPWGKLQINEERHSDFRRLQRLVFEEGRHIHGMIEQTQGRTITLYADKQKREESEKQMREEEARRKLEEEAKLIYRSRRLLTLLILLVFAAMSIVFLAPASFPSSDQLLPTWKGPQMKHEIEELRAQVSTLSSEKAVSAREIKTMNDKVSSLSSEKAALEKKLKIADNEISTLTSEKASLEQKVEMLTNDVASLSSKKAHLEKQVKRCWM